MPLALGNLPLALQDLRLALGGVPLAPRDLPRALWDLWLAPWGLPRALGNLWLALRGLRLAPEGERQVLGGGTLVFGGGPGGDLLAGNYSAGGTKKPSTTSVKVIAVVERAEKSLKHSARGAQIRTSAKELKVPEL